MIQLMKRLMVGLLALGFAAGALGQDIWTGGVGQQARDMAPDRNTRIEFFTDGGPYLAQVDYVLYDSQGNRIHEGTSEGPWLLVNLNPGNYSVKAERAETGEVQSVRFGVASSGQQVVGLKFDR